MRFDAGVRCDDELRSYGKRLGQVQRFALAFAVTWLVFAGPVGSAEATIKLVALGDSLTAGYQLPANAAFPAQLEKVLRARGVGVQIENAGVSGDTATSGLARLDWSVPDGVDGVILELGANDMLRGIDPKVTRKALQQIVSRLQARHIAILLCGMRAAPNLGVDYVQAFDAIYPAIAADNGVLFYPFFLDGVVTDAKLKQSDGMHPTAAGVAVIVERILPKVEALLAQIRAKSKS
jgi:acyl-CoA thioesterase-1